MDGTLDGERFRLRVRSTDRPRSPVVLSGTLSQSDGGTLVRVDPDERAGVVFALDIRSTGFRILLAVLLASSAAIAVGPTQSDGGPNLVALAAPWVASAVAIVVLFLAATWQKAQRPSEVEARSYLEEFLRAALESEPVMQDR